MSVSRSRVRDPERTIREVFREAGYVDGWTDAVLADYRHGLAEKQRAFMDTALKMSPWATGPDGRPLRIDALIDLIDPQKEGQ